MNDAFHMQHVILHLRSLHSWSSAHLCTPGLPASYSCFAISLPPLSCRSTSGSLFLSMPCSPALKEFTLLLLIDRHGHHSRSEDRNQQAALCPRLNWLHGGVGGRGGFDKLLWPLHRWTSHWCLHSVCVPTPHDLAL